MAHRNVTVDVQLKMGGNVAQASREARREVDSLRQTFSRSIPRTPQRTTIHSGGNGRGERLESNRIQREIPVRPQRARVEDFIDEEKATAHVAKSQSDRMWQLMGREGLGRAVRENLESDEGAKMHRLLQSLSWSASAEETAARRQQLAVEFQNIGSRDHMRALREDAALRRQTARTEQANKHAARIAEFGSTGAFLRRFEEMMAGPGRMGRNVALGGMGMIAGLAASNPTLGATLGGSMQLMTGSIAQIFIPQIMTMAGAVQQLAARLSNMDDSTRRGIGTTATFAIGLGAAAWGLSAVFRTGRRIHDVWRAVGTLGQASPLAPMTGSRGGFLGLAGRAVGRVARAGGLSLAGFAGAEIADAFGAPPAVGGGIMGGATGLSLAQLLGTGGRFLGPLGMLVGSGLANNFAQAQIQQQAQQMGQQAPNVQAAVQNALAQFENAGMANQARSRFRALQGALQPFGINPEQLGLFYDRSEWFGLSRPVDPRLSGPNFAGGGPLGAARIQELAAQAAQLAQQQPGGGAQAAAAAFRPGLGHFLAWDTNFQSRQIGVADLHDVIQAEAVRTPLQQALFAQDMQSMQMLLQWMRENQGQVQPLLQQLINAVQGNPAGAAP